MSLQDQLIDHLRDMAMHSILSNFLDEVRDDPEENPNLNQQIELDPSQYSVRDADQQKSHLL